MKRLLIIGLIFMNTMPVFAESYFAPQWNEFCPNQYANLDPEKDYILAEKKYWQKRKKDFDRKIKRCNSIINEYEKEKCYNDLRQIEGNATALHIQELRIRQEQLNGATGMMNADNYQVNTTTNVLRNQQPAYIPYPY